MEQSKTIGDLSHENLVLGVEPREPIEESYDTRKELEDGDTPPDGGARTTSSILTPSERTFIRL